jgi:proteasome beta subunit
MAFGVIEDRFVEKIPVEDGMDLAIRALASAMKRDSASGNDMHVVKITEKGYVEVEKDEIDKRKAALDI